jgi:hypothetical protein
MELQRFVVVADRVACVEDQVLPAETVVVVPVGLPPVEADRQTPVAAVVVPPLLAAFLLLVAETVVLV